MTSIPEYFKQQSKQLDFKTIRYNLYKLGVKSSYDDDRIILTYDSDKKNTSELDLDSCNGLILNRNDWTPLVIPTRVLKKKVELTDKKYTVYYIEDGTIFNLYYYNQWVISTSNGYDMNNVSWDSKTYKDLINDCLLQYNLNWDDFTNLLDKNLCYTFGFKHPEFHKFQAGSKSFVYKLWFVQSVNLTTNEIKTTSPVECINGQVLYNHNITDNKLLLQQLNKLASSALQTYTDYLEEYHDSKESDYLSNFINYGYIIKSDNENFIIESSLLQKIRIIWYYKPFIDLCKENNWNRVKAVVLNSYLDNNKYKVFLQLFPQYKVVMDKYSSIINDIITNLINKNNIEFKNLKDYINKNIKIPTNLSINEKRKIISDIVINVKCMTLLMEYI